MKLEKPSIIAVDFGSDNRDALTARNGQPLENPNPLSDAVEWFASNGIPLYGIQRNPSQDTWTSSPKAYANVYIDDAALGCPLMHGLSSERPFVDWAVVEQMLFGGLA